MGVGVHWQSVVCLRSDQALASFIHGEVHLGLNFTLSAGSDMLR